MANKLEDLKFYLVRNSDGEFFRRKGQNGHGDTWVDDLGIARVYTKIGPARAVVTFFANHYEQFPVPDLVELSVGTITVLDETQRVNKAREAKANEAATRERREAQRRLEDAERELVRAEENFQRAKRGS